MSLVCIPREMVARLVRLAKQTADAHEASEQPRHYVEARLERQADIVQAWLNKAVNVVDDIRPFTTPGQRLYSRDRRRRSRSRRRR